jgi:hypothetical protein
MAERNAGPTQGERPVVRDHPDADKHEQHAGDDCQAWRRRSPPWARYRSLARAAGVSSTYRRRAARRRERASEAVAASGSWHRRSERRTLTSGSGRSSGALAGSSLLGVVGRLAAGLQRDNGTVGATRGRSATADALLVCHQAGLRQRIPVDTARDGSWSFDGPFTMGRLSAAGSVVGTGKYKHMKIRSYKSAASHGVRSEGHAAPRARARRSQSAGRRPSRGQPGSTASIASRILGASGGVSESNRATTLPSGATRNFSKFQRTFPA